MEEQGDGDNIVVSNLQNVIGAAIGAGATANVTIQHPISSEDRRNQRNHSILRQAVKAFWIDGVLNHSLYNEVLLRLGMQRRIDAVDNLPWKITAGRPDQSAQSIPPGTRVLDIFDAVGHQLLILGEPGSGKTTMLLDLARDLLDRAEADPTQASPVVFNLSSWAERTQPLSQWLVEELNIRYTIPKNVGQTWVNNDELILLLDGLDEVRPAAREVCVEAINRFRQEHMMPLVICCRISEYKELTTKLRLQDAILLEPLTLAQIDISLDAAGKKLPELRALLHHNAEFRRLAQTPFMLSIMIMAYHDLTDAKQFTDISVETLRQRLFNDYIKSMFSYHEFQHQYPIGKTILWLYRLANNQYGNALINPKLAWMNPGSERNLYIRILMLVIALFGGIIGGVFGWIHSGAIGAVMGGVLYGMLYGLGFGLLFELVMRLRYSSISRTLRDLQLLIRQVASEQALSNLAGSIEGPIVKIQWSWTKLQRDSLTDGLLFGLAFGGIFTFLAVLRNGFIDGLLNGSIYGLMVGTLGGILSGLVPVFTKIDRSDSSIIYISARNGATAGLLAGGLAGSIVGLTFGPVVGVFSGLLFGLFLGLGFGGLAYIRYLLHRLVLWLQGYMPWNQTRFLDYCVDQVFLRKVGDGYIFIHRLLMEHFAAMTENDAELLAEEISRQRQYL